MPKPLKVANSLPAKFDGLYRGGADVVQPATLGLKAVAACNDSCEPYNPDDGNKPLSELKLCDHRKAAAVEFAKILTIGESATADLEAFCSTVFGEHATVADAKQMKANLKGVARGTFKIANHKLGYSGDSQQLKDACRISVIFPDARALYAGLRSVLDKAGDKTFQNFGPVRRLKDRVLNPPGDPTRHGSDSPAGPDDPNYAVTREGTFIDDTILYRDLQICIEYHGNASARGYLCEIQLHLESLWKTKNLKFAGMSAGGHALYKQYRGMAEGSPKRKALIRLSNYMYDAAVDKEELKTILTREVGG